jgi:drug/metabolite transporter (DMT)-like permease
MVLEPVWAAFFGFALWEDSLDVRTVVGAALVLVAMLLVVTRPSSSKTATVGAAEVGGVGAVVKPDEHA